jgi:hypothetical protein
VSTAPSEFDQGTRVGGPPAGLGCLARLHSNIALAIGGQDPALKYQNGGTIFFDANLELGPLDRAVEVGC